jgi:hypothetical protein
VRVRRGRGSLDPRGPGGAVRRPRARRASPRPHGAPRWSCPPGARCTSAHRCATREARRAA